MNDRPNNRSKTLKRLARGVQALSDRLNSGVEILSVFFLTALVIVVGIKIVARYIAIYPMPWTEEIAKFLLTWSVLLGVSIAFKKGELVASTYLLTKLPDSVVFWLFGLIQLVVFTLLVVFMAEGWSYAATGRAAVSPMLRIPLFYSYVVVPVTSGFCLVHQLALVLNIDRDKLRAYAQPELDVE